MVGGSKKYFDYNKKLAFQKITGTFRRQVCSYYTQRYTPKDDYPR
jgi:hypothetical protein